MSRLEGGQNVLVHETFLLLPSRLSKDTPLPTPTHKYNAWANNRKSLGITPQERNRRGGGAGEPEEKVFLNEAERKEWEEDQKVCAYMAELCPPSSCVCFRAPPL